MKRFIIILVLLFMTSYQSCNATTVNINEVFDKGLSNIRIEKYSKTLQLSSAPFVKSAYEKFVTGNYKGAVKDCSVAIEINPNDFLAYSLRSFCFCKTKKYQAALEDSSKAIELKPDEYFIYCLRSICKFKLRDYTGAIKDCNVALTFNEDTDYVYSIKALNEFKLKDYKNSISHCERAIEINPDCYLAYFIRGLNKTELDDFKGALKDYKTGIEVSKNTTKVLKSASNDNCVQNVSQNRKITIEDIEKRKEECEKANKTADVDFRTYMKALQKKIKSNWDPPKLNSSKRIVVKLKIMKDGTLADLKIHQSSGNIDADKAAIYAVNVSKPFQPLPKGYKENSVDILFTFDYKVFGGSNN